jgi:hypothetical protein
VTCVVGGLAEARALNLGATDGETATAAEKLWNLGLTSCGAGGKKRMSALLLAGKDSRQRTQRDEPVR